MNGPIRRLTAEVLISLGVVAFSLAAILSVARRALFYPVAFADRLAPLDNAPTIVAAALDLVNEFPQFPADVPDP